MRSSALTLVTQCRFFSFFYFFLDSFSSQKKTWLGQKIGTKNLKWSALYKIHMFSVLFFRKIWAAANFPVAISRDFFLPFLLPKFSVAQPSPLHCTTTHTENSSTGAAKEVNCTVLLTVILSRSIHQGFPIGIYSQTYVIQYIP